MNLLNNSTSFLGKTQELTAALQQQNQNMLDILKKKNVDIFQPEIEPLMDYSLIEGEDKSLASFKTGEQYANTYMYNRYLKYALGQNNLSMEQSIQADQTDNTSAENIQSIINKALGL